MSSQETRRPPSDESGRPENYCDTETILPHHQPRQLSYADHLAGAFVTSMTSLLSELRRHRGSRRRFR